MSRNWSFDYFHKPRSASLSGIIHAEEAFLDLFRTYQEKAYPKIVAKDTQWSLNYAILPNWRPTTLRRNLPKVITSQDIIVGKTTISKKIDTDADLHFSVDYDNQTSGEKGVIDFSCNNDRFRTIKGEWHSVVENTADGDYNTYELWGRLAPIGLDTQLLEVSHNGSDYITLGPLAQSTPCTFNWALYDLLPDWTALDWDGEKRTFAFLEDMEKLKVENTLGYLEDFTPDIDGEQVNLKGYYLHGRGTIPTYFWLDDHGHVVIVTNIYITYILQEVVL